MGLHGSQGVSCASMGAAARRAVTPPTCAPLAPPDAGAAERSRTGAAADARARPERPVRPVAALHAHAPHDCLRAPVTGGGPSLAAARPTVGPDPAVAVLAGLLGEASPSPRGESPVRQLVAQLGSLFSQLGGRVAALAPEPATSGSAAPAAEAAADSGAIDVAPVVRQPPPPPIGPILSLDPVLGVIVDPADPTGPADRDGGHGTGDGSSTDHRDEFAPPTSWVPVPSGLLRRVRRGLGSLADRVDALLAEVGMTRLQLLLLTLLGPAAVAFAIDVVVQLLESR